MFKRLARYILRSELPRLSSRIDDLNETNDILRADCGDLVRIEIQDGNASMVVTSAGDAIRLGEKLIDLGTSLEAGL